MHILQRIQNDRLGPELAGHGMDPVRERGYRDGWNDCSANLERAVKGFEQRERMDKALAELAEAPAMDMRLKHALIAMDVNPLPAETVTPFGQQAAATPTAGEVVGGLEVRS